MSRKLIDSFRGDYNFLSNFYPCTVVFDGLSYPSAEHAYQASKSDDPNVREIVRNLLDAATARSYGKRIVMAPDFLSNRISYMEAIVLSKFTHRDNIELTKRLLDTGDAILIEGNTWGDFFWGVCRGRGSNHLGIILMNVRAQILEATKRAHAAGMSKISFSDFKNSVPVASLLSGPNLPPENLQHDSRIVSAAATTGDESSTQGVVLPEATVD
jgi:ribA/ribD-fused uncharacterized protein